MVGLGGLEPPTSRLSSARSNQLSYKPELSDNPGAIQLDAATYRKTEGFASCERSRQGALDARL